MLTVLQVIHRGPTMWIVNKYGWIGNGNIDQCICINIREGGNASNPNPIYPINYNWVDNLGSDSIDIWILGCTYRVRLKGGPRLREYCKQGQAEVMSKSTGQ